MLLQDVHPTTVLLLEAIPVEAALQKPPVKPGVQAPLPVHGAEMKSALVGTAIRPHKAPMAVELSTDEGALVGATITPLVSVCALAAHVVLLEVPFVGAQDHRLVGGRLLLTSRELVGRRCHGRAHLPPQTMAHKGALALAVAELALAIEELAAHAEALVLEDLRLRRLLLLILLLLYLRRGNLRGLFRRHLPLRRPGSATLPPAEGKGVPLDAAVELPVT
mmetsp:Transcript_35361/g.75326  ORF Transcript_35361/g.75326 Transcript_35361/m.75326 type:complete len:221 (+) Transcript_35361:1097-1759(+)